VAEYVRLLGSEVHWLAFGGKRYKDLLSTPISAGKRLADELILQCLRNGSEQISVKNENDGR
jgi:hypothetical protein